MLRVTALGNERVSSPDTVQSSVLLLFPTMAETSGESVEALAVGTFARQRNERKDSSADSWVLLSLASALRKRGVSEEDPPPEDHDDATGRLQAERVVRSSLLQQKIKTQNPLLF